MFESFCVVVGVVSLLTIFFAFLTNYPPLTVVADLTGKLGTIASGLVAAAVIVERAVEIVIGVPRDGEAQKLKAEARSAPNEVSKQKSLADFQKKTKTRAVALSFVLGGVLAVFGVRILAQFFTFPATPQPALTAVDVVFTAAVLAGGGQGVHLLFSTIGNYLNSLKPKS